LRFTDHDFAAPISAQGGRDRVQSSDLDCDSLVCGRLGKAAKRGDGETGVTTVKNLILRWSVPLHHYVISDIDPRREGTNNTA
jgi:hypothetical protein